MAVRVTYIAIAVGGACGAFAALVGAPSTAPPLPAPGATLPMRPISEPRPLPTAAPAAATSARSATSGSLATAAGAPAVANANATAAAILAAAPLAGPAAAAAAPPVSSADSTPAPDTKEALLRAEMHCDQKDASACIHAARGYELGSAGTSDPEKAVKYRKIALTLWISQCDHNSASACATLAEMYRVGRGVPQSDRNADALLARTRELCHYNDAPVCHELPSP